MIKFIDNQNFKLVDILRPAIDDSQNARFAVSFVKQSGLALIQKNIEQCINKGGYVEFLISLDFQITEAKAIKALIGMADSGEPVRCYCYRHTGSSETATYHPKLYILSGQNTVNLIVGSSNLTNGGLRTNAEANIIVNALQTDEITSDVYELYNRLKFLRNRFEPDLDYVEQYGEISSMVQRKNKSVLRDRSIRGIMESLQAREEKFPKLGVSQNDLVGWQKIVFKKLPTGIFSNNDIYAFEHEFQQYYPSNQNVRAKVRQFYSSFESWALLSTWGQIDGRDEYAIIRYKNS